MEPLGDVTIVSLSANGIALRIVLPEAQAVGMKAGDALPIVIDAAKLNLFRKHDGSASKTDNRDINMGEEASNAMAYQISRSVECGGSRRRDWRGPGPRFGGETLR